MPSNPIFYAVVITLAVLLILVCRAATRREQERFEHHCARVREEVRRRAEARAEIRATGGCRPGADERWA